MHLICCFFLIASTICLPSEDQKNSVKSNVEQSDVKTEQSDEDATEKVPKRTASVKAVKKVTKVEVCIVHL